MHIPDGFLDPKIATGMIGVAAAVLGYSLARVREAVTSLKPAEALATVGKEVGSMVGGMRWVLTGKGESTIYKMGIVASLVFVAQMFNFPVSQGTTGHLLGGAFAAIILGPFAGSIVMAVVLATQALFLSDGGLLALGANIINMAGSGAILGYYLYCQFKKRLPDWLAIFVTTWLSVLLASLAYAIELRWCGTAVSGISIPTIFKVHLAVGLAEALITLALVKFFVSWGRLRIYEEF